MLSFAVGVGLTPSELPNIWSLSPLCSNHASVLHEYPLRSGMVCPQEQSRHKLCSCADGKGDKCWRRLARLLLCCGDYALRTSQASLACTEMNDSANESEIDISGLERLRNPQV